MFVKSLNKLKNEILQSTRTNNIENILYKSVLNNRVGVNMAEIINNNWTIEEKIAFEAWLKISIEMIEKYCVSEENQENTSNLPNI